MVYHDYHDNDDVKNLIGFKTVRFVKLLGEKVNVGEWVGGILRQCNLGPIMLVNLGISYTVGKGVDNSADYQVKYMYCSKSEAYFSELFRTRKEAYDWADSLLKLDDPIQIMSLTRMLSDERFMESGWTGRTPIAMHLWIQK